MASSFYDYSTNFHPHPDYNPPFFPQHTSLGNSFEELLRQPGFQASSDTPLFEVVNSGMEPAFYVHLQLQTYEDRLSDMTPIKYKYDSSKLNIWFEGVEGNESEHYHKCKRPTDLGSFSKSSYSVTLMEGVHGREIAMLRANPKDESSTETWGIVGFRWDACDEWKIELSQDGLHTVDGEELIFRAIKPRPFLRWACLFDGSPLFSEAGPHPEHLDTHLPKLIGDRAMLWALSAWYYMPDRALEYSLPRMFREHIYCTDAAFYARRSVPGPRDTNEIVVATVYQRKQLDGTSQSNEIAII